MEFHKPQNLNGHQLREELLAAGIVIDKLGIGCQGEILFLDIQESDFDKAAEVVANHIGKENYRPIDESRRSLIEKLGLTEVEAQILFS